MVRTFIQWLKILSRSNRPDTKQVRIEFAEKLANMYNGTDDCDIAGLWMTFAEKEKTLL